MVTGIQQRIYILFIIALNLIPIWGVLYWDWTPFYVFYLFWLETLIVAIFNTFKIIGCRGHEYSEKLHKSGHKYSGLHVNYASHTGKAIRYLLIRIGIFCFYLVFIVAFIGITAGKKNEKLSIFELMFFRNPAFNYTLVAFILNQLIQLMFNFYVNGNYKRTHPSDFASIFDGRQLIVHVAVVLGGFIAAQKQVFNTSLNPDNISIVIVSIFCLVKSVFEVFKFMTEKNTIGKRDGSYLPSTALSSKYPPDKL